jgi:ParB family chromosome partitioning protein
MSETTTTPVGALEHLPPDTLEIAANVRTEAAVTKQFVASVAENGVLVPITAVRGSDGAVRVRTGQRRTLAARQAGLTTVPVYVLAADDPYDTVDRVVDQISENDHRVKLSDSDRVFGIQLLLDAGLSVTKTAKKLARPAAYVKDAQAVAASQTAIDALHEGQVTLGEASVLAEFDGNDNALERLLRAAGTARFDQLAAQIRAEQAEAAELQRAEQQWAEQGYTVLDGQPASFDPACIPLDQLRRPDGTDAGVADVTTPAQWAVLVGEDDVFVDKETGEVVDEDTIDWNTETDPDATPEKGLRHYDTVTEATGFVPEYFCLDYQAAGLTPTARFVQFGGVNNFPGVEVDEMGPKWTSEYAGNGVTADPDTEKRERRKVLALNRLGDAAIGVRREFVTGLLARKTAPKGAAIFVAKTLASNGYLLTDYKADEITAALLGTEPEHVLEYGHRNADIDEYAGGVRGLLANVTDGRAAVITLGLVLGALEGRTPKDAWRGDHGYVTRAAGPPEYLTFLAEQGYTLAPVEEIITGAATSDAVYDAWLAEK